MPYPPVTSKAQFVRLFAAGVFGNRGPTWLTLRDYLASGYRGLVHLRNRTPGGATYYNLTEQEATDRWRALARRSEHRGWYLAAMAPHRYNLLQGELTIGACGLDLYYSTVTGLPMRDALALDGTRAQGIIAICLLRRALCANSYEWTQTLLRRYPNHVIEFSSFSRNWGVLPNFNTVWWEVRMY